MMNSPMIASGSPKKMSARTKPTTTANMIPPPLFFLHFNPAPVEQNRYPGCEAAAQQGLTESLQMPEL